MFTCQQPGGTSRWDVTLLSGTRLRGSALSSNVGEVFNLSNDPGFGFELHVLPSSSSSSVISELRVTAVMQLNGITVECVGGSGTLSSTIQISSVGELVIYYKKIKFLSLTACDLCACMYACKDPPAAPSGVTTTANERQFTPSTASITVTWSASSGVDNYTIMVTPLLPSGQSLVSTASTSLQLTVLYNEDYSINITTQNCAGRNSTIVSLTVGNRTIKWTSLALIFISLSSWLQSSLSTC